MVRLVCKYFTKRGSLEIAAVTADCSCSHQSYCHGQWPVSHTCHWFLVSKARLCKISFVYFCETGVFRFQTAAQRRAAIMGQIMILGISLALNELLRLSLFFDLSKLNSLCPGAAAVYSVFHICWKRSFCFAGSGSSSVHSCFRSSQKSHVFGSVTIACVCKCRMSFLACRLSFVFGSCLVRAGCQIHPPIICIQSLEVSTL